ncbi:cell division protein [Bifidobacterium pullorum subsp. saeculare]|uniref:Cell division protein n=1 Tax=Bifidobacterium pullorum subsp. saeculare TaxID=78257 RepID=A0A939BA58_9BIFI|nr:cell division protein [Bifidobacterium pullorum]MBM6700248.1 cell division protein [Bifidobacterium pullorum subsp. saeculare]
MSDDPRPTGYVDLTEDRTNETAATPAATAPGTPAPAPAAPAPTAPAAPAITEPYAPAPAPASASAPEDGGRRPVSPFPLPDLRDMPQEDSEEDAGRAEFTTVFDIIDKMDAALADAKAGLFSPTQVKVDRELFASYLTDLKRMLPVQLERASALMREAERRLEGAQTQANAIVASAQSRAADTIKEANEQAQFLAGQENVTELARQKARQILDTAQAKADHLTHGADDYSTKVMEALRQQLDKMGRDVDAGLNVLHERQKAAAQDLPHLDINDYPEA